MEQREQGIALDELEPYVFGRVLAPVTERSFVEISVKAIHQVLKQFLKSDSGTETLEWGLVCGLIVVGAIAAITTIGPKIATLWNNVNNSIP